MGAKGSERGTYVVQLDVAIALSHWKEGRREYVKGRS